MATVGSSSTKTEVIAYQEEGLLIKIKYDTWTPRPHLVVVLFTPKPNANSTELQMTYEMIGRFLQQKPQFDANAILCFRCGTWKLPDTKQWQARLCISREPYLDAARIAIRPENVPNPAKNWEGPRYNNIEDAMNEWYVIKRREGAEYKKKCYPHGIPNESVVGFVSLSTLNSISSEFELVWTSPAPRIGIIALSPAKTSLANLYRFMAQIHSDIETKLRQRRGETTTFNCHLCLYVRGQSGTTVTCRQGEILSEDGQLTTNENLVGYIQIAESQYLEWLPHQARQTWFDAFRQTEHLVET